MTRHVTERLFAIDGRIVAVIGATPIGIAAADLLSQAGGTVTLLPTRPGRDSAPGIDLTAESSVTAALDHIVARHGRLDVLVYAETQPGTCPIVDMTLAQWDHLQSVNLRGAFLVMREAVRHMRVTGGRIIAVSTMGSLHPVLHGNAAYGAAKAGLNGLVRALALDHAADGILVNAVLPGAVPVGPMMDGSISAGGPAFEPGRLKLGTGTSEDIAAAILYLASPAGRFMTGQNLVLDGGFLVS